MEAHSSCRCDGGNTMGCGACRAERRIAALLGAGMITRTPTSKAFTNPVYTLVSRFHGETSGRFSSTQPNRVNTPKLVGHVRRTEDYDGNVDGCIADCPGCTVEAACAYCGASGPLRKGSHPTNHGKCAHKPRWILHATYAHLDTHPCFKCGTQLGGAPKPDRELLLEIGNIIGGTTCGYNSAVEVAEWRRRAVRITDLIQAQLKGGTL